MKLHLLVHVKKFVNISSPYKKFMSTLLVHKKLKDNFTKTKSVTLYFFRD